MVTLGRLLFVVSLAAVDAQSQDSPYRSPPPDGNGFILFQIVENLPVWAQAATISAVASLTALVLIELARSAWERWQRRHLDTSRRHES